MKIKPVLVADPECVLVNGVPFGQTEWAEKCDRESSSCVGIVYADSKYGTLCEHHTGEVSWEDAVAEMYDDELEVAV